MAGGREVTDREGGEREVGGDSLEPALERKAAGAEGGGEGGAVEEAEQRQRDDGRREQRHEATPPQRATASASLLGSASASSSSSSSSSLATRAVPSRARAAPAWLAGTRRRRGRAGAEAGDGERRVRVK